MDTNSINVDMIYRESCKGGFESFDSSYMTFLNLAFKKDGSVLYFAKRNPDIDLKKSGSLHAFEPRLIRDIVMGKTLDSVFDFDMRSDESTGSYNIFVKEGRLYISDNFRRINGILCGRYNGKLMPKDTAKTIEVKYLDIKV